MKIIRHTNRKLYSYTNKSYITYDDAIDAIRQGALLEYTAKDQTKNDIKWFLTSLAARVFKERAKSMSEFDLHTFIRGEE